MPADRFEVIVVDNGSQDATPTELSALVASTPLNARMARIEANHGPAQARNLGWRKSHAPVIAFLDDDCVPVPGWLEAGVAALEADDRVGVVQGATQRPPGTALGDWTLFREVLEPTPYFEACNIFYRREALERTGGFDEVIGWYGEDTELGWSVLDSGWRRGFAREAVAFHDVVERGLGWHIHNAYLQGNLVAIAKRHPQMAREAFWRPWAFHRYEPWFALGAAGVAITMTSWRRPWRRPAVLLFVQWYRLRRPPPRHHRWLALLGERFVVDAAATAGMAVASVRAPKFVN
jgi:GT2 family glycosyltransferase